MKKSTLIMILSLVLAVAIGVGSTMAYLQDTDEDVNVMTLGNVYIDQIELERDENGELQQFTQGKPLYPAVYDGYAWDPENVKWPDVSETADSKVFDDEKMSNVIDKFVFVKNTGNSDAYVRTIMAFELGSYDIEKVLASDTPLIHLNVNDKNESETGKGHWDFKWLDEIVTIDGNNYALVEAVYLHKNSVQGTPEEGILPAGATSYPSLLQLFMDKSAKNEDIEAIDGNKNGTYDILVVSQAVQTMGFTDAQTALDEAFGPITAENNPWKKGGVDLDGTPAFPVFVDTAEEMVAALNEGGKIEVQADIALTETMNVEKASEINLNGHTLTASVFEAKADTTLKNGKFVSGESTYPQLSVSAGTLKLENMDILCEEYCNLVTSGSAQAAEYAGLQVWGGKAVLDNCNITVNTDEVRYSNSVFAIGIHEGEVTMNGGSITINSHGSTKEKYNYEGAIFAGSDPDKVINLNNVTMNLGDRAGHKLLFAWGGNTTVNTTDAKDSWIPDLIDARGKYIINYVD